MLQSKRLNSAESAKYLNIYESQLKELEEKHLLPRWSAGYSEADLAKCKLKMKSVKLAAPDQNSLMNMAETMVYASYTKAELIEFGHSGKLQCHKHMDGWRFTRQAIDSFKARLKLAGI